MRHFTPSVHGGVVSEPSYTQPSFTVGRSVAGSTSWSSGAGASVADAILVKTSSRAALAAPLFKKTPSTVYAPSLAVDEVHLERLRHAGHGVLAMFVKMKLSE